MTLIAPEAVMNNPPLIICPMTLWVIDPNSRGRRRSKSPGAFNPLRYQQNPGSSEGSLTRQFEEIKGLREKQSAYNSKTQAAGTSEADSKRETSPMAAQEALRRKQAAQKEQDRYSPYRTLASLNLSPILFPRCCYIYRPALDG